MVSIRLENCQRNRKVFYIYSEINLRTCPGTLRGTEEWDNTCKIRVMLKKIHVFINGKITSCFPSYFHGYRR